MNWFSALEWIEAKLASMAAQFSIAVWKLTPTGGEMTSNNYPYLIVTKIHFLIAYFEALVNAWHAREPIRRLRGRWHCRDCYHKEAKQREDFGRHIWVKLKG
jgi:hypothetical protein